MSPSINELVIVFRVGKKKHFMEKKNKNKNFFIVSKKKENEINFYILTRFELLYKEKTKLRILLLSTKTTKIK